MNINYPRRHINRNASSGSLAPSDLSGPRRGNSSDLSLFGESSRDLLGFSRFLEENQVDTKNPVKSTRRRKSVEKSSSTCSMEIDSPPAAPAALSTRHGFHEDASKHISPSNNDHLNTPRSVEMTNTQPDCSKSFVPPFVEEKCSPRCVVSHYSMDDSLSSLSSDCYDSPLKPHSSLSSKRLQQSSPLKKAPPVIQLQKKPTRSASESVARSEPNCGPGDGSSSRSRSRSNTNNNNNSSITTDRLQKCSSAHSLQWDRVMVEVVPGYTLPLAGLQESIAAYQRQAVEETICDACQRELFCIDSASMVLCPFCRSFSPIYTTTLVNDEEQLGLGLTVELLAEEFNKL